jgi:large subunit ribosomal protein L10e
MGDIKGQFDIEGQLLATERVQIRHSALEAARVATNRILMDKLINDYYLTVHTYPHIILRENKMIFGAHADRLQQGMRRSFGTAIGTAAKVEVGQPIITVRVKATALETAKEALKRGSAKLPIHCKIVITKIQQAPSKTEEAPSKTEQAQPESEII